MKWLEKLIVIFGFCALWQLLASLGLLNTVQNTAVRRGVTTRHNRKPNKGLLWLLSSYYYWDRVGFLLCSNQYSV